MRGVLFEARYWWLQKDRNLFLLAQEQMRSTVYLHFTAWHAFQLVVLHDPGLTQLLGHGGVPTEVHLLQALEWSLTQHLWPYLPPPLSTAV